MGWVDGDDLGFTLTHEHVFYDFGNYWAEPTDFHEKELAYQPITLENLCWGRYHKVSCKDNMVFSERELELAVREIMYFKEAGQSWMLHQTMSAATRLG